MTRALLEKINRMLEAGTLSPPALWLQEAIRGELAQPAGEPVACLVDSGLVPMVWPIAYFDEAGTHCEIGEFPKLLYTHPQHTEEEVQEILDAERMLYRQQLETTVRRILGVKA